MANGQNAAILGRIAETVTGALVNHDKVHVNSFQAPTVEKVIKEAVASDPVLVNETNSEKPYQSRVTVGNAVALLAILLNFFGVDMAPEDQLALVNLITGILAIWGIGYSLYGRWAPRLKPLFSRK